ncbi:UNVERIFIED_CONTAM: Ankyrin repeat domain-containing protein 53 [Sesamum angustifolium]|uniref:Ankyrin repeat domain-containing protein 53 n=1 Tax=Sesamum angustifolium TaxID=2727405 RepID=A0AAW2QTF6_9LAMI
MNRHQGLLDAAAAGDLERLKHLEGKCQNADVFRNICELVKDKEGQTALHCAATAGKTQICKYLVEKLKVEMNPKTGEGDTPLLLAVMVEQLPTANYLIKQGADVKASDFKGMTALHYAAERGDKKLMQLLISQGAEVEAESDHGTPLQRAASHGEKEAVQILLDHKSNPNFASPLLMTPVMLSIVARSFECLDMLLKITEKYMLLLFFHFLDSKLRLVISGSLFLNEMSAGADPNLVSCGITPLAFTASSSESEIDYMKFLLKAGADPNVVGTAGMTPLECAAFAGNVEAVMILLPVTSRIPSIPDWSFHGIMSHIHSEEAKEQREFKEKENFLLAKQRGGDAFKKNDYLSAMVCYTEAISLCPGDATMLSNRSLCWARLNEGKRALSDAQSCVHLRPDWPKAHYREGVAWRLLGKYSMASEAFSHALRLDPENKEIHKALKEAVKADNIKAFHGL